ncbi:hypothetical protein C2G38_2154326 [Gigaspora rosea]|uniref:Uncharacterized protein n=1 Tax=Gigaspora rosea TaxID=44941 RepID=A0A397W735_9GLOM|nr:hypothetical protein C2G38_2154326 [Gigaspora rosea]
MNTDAEEDKDIVDNVEKESSRIGYDDVNETIMDYANKIGLTWKYRNKEISLGHFGSKVIRNILGVNVVVCGIEVKQPFYIIQKLNFDVVLGIAWIARSRCIIQYKDDECYYTIERVIGR